MYDSVDGYLLLFGGGGSGCSVCNDTWEFSHGSWTQLHPAKSPAPRYDSLMAYDPSIHEVVMGGGYGSGNLTDMWEFAGGIWTQIAPLVAHAPFRGRYSVMSFDPADRALIFFGNNGTVTGDQTWKFLNGNWSQLAPRTSPVVVLNAVEFEYAMAYSTRLHSMILTVALTPANNSRTTTWGFGSGVWTQLFPNASPPVRLATEETYDGATQTIVLFGGVTSVGVPLNDTWVLG